MKSGLIPAIILFLLLTGACKKDFLDKKPSTGLVIPNTLTDLQGLIDNQNVMQYTPWLGELSTDDYSVQDTKWQSAYIIEKNAYIWKPDIYEGQTSIDDWNIPYQQVFYANVILDRIQGIPMDAANQRDWNKIKGAALFLRAYAFFNLLECFAKPYDSQTAGQEPGIPLRLSPDVNAKAPRATVKAGYDQVIADLMAAKEILPTSVEPNNRNRPNKPAALAMLARSFFYMRDYAHAEAYADSALAIFNVVIDFNTISTSANIPFTRSCPEVMYQSVYTGSQFLFGAASGSNPDSVLYGLYGANDLRKLIKFRIIASSGLVTFKGFYSGVYYPFTGLATNEMYFIKAECLARKGNTGAAMDKLNELLSKRYMTGAFQPLSAGTPAQALDTILLERRKEFIFSGIRWMDLRRLNAEGRQITLTRTVNGQQYKLLPNSASYVFPIPDNELIANPMDQNPPRQ